MNFTFLLTLIAGCAAVSAVSNLRRAALTMKSKKNKKASDLQGETFYCPAWLDQRQESYPAQYKNNQCACDNWFQCTTSGDCEYVSDAAYTTPDGKHHGYCIDKGQPALVKPAVFIYDLSVDNTTTTICNGSVAFFSISASKLVFEPGARVITTTSNNNVVPAPGSDAYFTEFQACTKATPPCQAGEVVLTNNTFHGSITSNIEGSTRMWIGPSNVFEGKKFTVGEPVDSRGKANAFRTIMPTYLLDGPGSTLAGESGTILPMLTLKDATLTLQGTNTTVVAKFETPGTVVFGSDCIAYVECGPGDGQQCQDKYTFPKPT